MNCQSITLSGELCKNKAKCDKQYCHLHYTEYIQIDGWPSINEIRKYVKTYPNEDEMLDCLKRNYKDLDKANKIEKIIIFMMTFELLLKNEKFDYSSDAWQRLIQLVIKKGKEHPHLKDYCKNFRRKFDLENLKLESKKTYIKHIFIHSELGLDIAEYIVSFIT